MGDRSAIAWTDATVNFWVGCDKVSPGCDACYAETLMKRWGKSFAIRRTGPATWTAPLRWKEPRMIFTCSMSDFFHAGADEWRGQAWDVIRRTPQHTYQILTKRPSRIARHLPSDWGEGYPNVWLGVSTENQEWLERRVAILCTIPAAVRFLSCEPLLEPLDFSAIGGLGILRSGWSPEVPGIDWVIVGGESGSQRRTCNVAWLTAIVDQCRAAGVPVFTKQDSAFKPGQQGRIPDEYWLKQFPEVPHATPQGETK